MSNWILILVFYGIGGGPVDGQPAKELSGFTEKGCQEAIKALGRLPHMQAKCIEIK